MSVSWVWEEKRCKWGKGVKGEELTSILRVRQKKTSFSSLSSNHRGGNIVVKVACLFYGFITLYLKIDKYTTQHSCTWHTIVVIYLYAVHVRKWDAHQIKRNLVLHVHLHFCLVTIMHKTITVYFHGMCYARKTIITSPALNNENKGCYLVWWSMSTKTGILNRTLTHR